MRHRIARRLPLGLALFSWALLYGPMLDLARLPLLRDLQVFHLPLRTEFARQLHAGILPVWNSLINGGQPILSNPNYAAFYPVTWLLAWLPQHTALNLLLFLHGLWAFWGAYRLVRRFGGGTGPASIAALVFSAGPLLGIYDTVTIFCSWSWFPWILGWAAEALRWTPSSRSREDDDRAWRRPATLAAVGFAMQLFAGDPTSVILTGLALAAFWLTNGPLRERRTWSRPAAIALLALLLAAVQLGPTLMRLRGTARAEGMIEAAATQWSMPPARYVELLFPRFYGHPTSDAYGLYFGRDIGDMRHPYLPTIYLGQLVLLFAVAGLILWRIPGRWAWLLMIFGGGLLALGHFNPVYESIIYRIPPFSLIRYPEKFFLLTCAAITFAGALAWDRLLAFRREGHPERADFPLVLAGVFAVLAGAYWGLLEFKPEWFDWLVRPHQFLPLPESMIERRLDYLQHWAVAALAIALTLVILLGLHRLRRVSETTVVVTMVFLVASDVAAAQMRIMQTSPVDALFTPVPVLQGISPRSGRIYTGSVPLTRLPYVEPGPRRPVPGRFNLEQAFPYGATLWGYAYALNPDFDYMLTRWGRRTLATFDEMWTKRQRKASYKFLGAWNVSTVILPTTQRQALEEHQMGESPPFAVARPNRYKLPRYRFVPKVTFHADLESALEGAHAEYYDFPASEHWVGKAPHDGPQTLARRNEVTDVKIDGRPGWIRVHYVATQPAAFVAAVTYHSGWTARVDGRRVETYPTETGQIGVLVPAGGHTLTFKFWEPAVTWGAAASFLGLLIAGAMWVTAGKGLAARAEPAAEA